MYLKRKFICWGCIICWGCVTLFVLWGLAQIGLPSNENEPLEISADDTPRCYSDLYSKEHELARRQVYNSIWDLYYYVSDQLRKTEVALPFKYHLLNQTISLIAQFQNFGSLVDSAGEWHRSELQKITDLVQNYLQRLQNPESCNKARILICELDLRGCGLGCLIHRVGYCLRMAVASGRTMVINKDAVGWKYSKIGWTSAFEPVSKCSFADINVKDNPHTNWTHVEQKDRVTFLYAISEEGIKRPDQLPLSFPKQFADKLLTHHSNPPIYFGAQFYYYVSRTNPIMTEMIRKTYQEIRLNDGPMVGLHIRRTDKLLGDSRLYLIEEYFQWADLYFDINDRRKNTKLKRRVYIATDDPSAIKEARQKYPHYEIFGNAKVAESADLKTRYTDASLFGVVTDYHVLSKCKYVICGHSSNICRIVLERIQVENGDAHDYVQSLDHPYHNHRQFEHEFVVIEDHVATNDEELSVRVGDIIEIRDEDGSFWKGSPGNYTPGHQGNLWNGYTMGFSRRTGKKGIFPSYKAKEKWRIVDYPTFV